MEIFSWHDGLKKWVEIGNSGMFRPEMLQPMGLPDNVSGNFGIFLIFRFFTATFKLFVTFSYCLGFEFGATCYDQIWFG